MTTAKVMNLLTVCFKFNSANASCTCSGKLFLIWLQNKSKTFQALFVYFLKNPKLS